MRKFPRRRRQARGRHHDTNALKFVFLGKVASASVQGWSPWLVEHRLAVAALSMLVVYEP
jgi:hypothetical protein